MTHARTDRHPWLALLALVPVLAYLTWRGGRVVGLSVVCVLLIAYSLFRMLADDPDPSI